MKFETEVEKAIDDWMALETWFKGEALEMGRFYEVVLRMFQTGERVGAGAILRGEIKTRAADRLEASHLETVASRLAEAADMILEFLYSIMSGDDATDPHSIERELAKRMNDHGEQ